MSLGESMISVLKSNKAIMLDKTKRFKKIFGSNYSEIKTEYNFPEATPAMLQTLRERLHKEQRQLMIKRFILFSVILIITIVILVKLN